MARQIVKGWEWVKTERLFDPEILKPKEQDPVVTSSRSNEGFKAVALAAGLMFGLVGLVWFQRKQSQPEPSYQPIGEPQIVYVPAPAPELPPIRQLELVVPESREDVERVLESARFWLSLAPTQPDHMFERSVWHDTWQGVRYPGPPHDGDHPSVGQARCLIRFALTLARTELQIKLETEGPMDPEQELEERSAKWTEAFRRMGFGLGAEPANEAPAEVVRDEPRAPIMPVELADEPYWAADVEDVEHQPAVAQVEMVERAPVISPEVEALVAERPTPGYFYRVDEEIAELGLEHLATQSIASVALEFAHRKGWSAEKAMSRARKLLENPSLCESYGEIIVSSKWNEPRVWPLQVGTLVWLPPLRVAVLFDRSRQPKATLDPRPWDDGSSRLEPPPVAWAA